MKVIPRIPLTHFPDVVMHTSESSVKQHPAYADAKAGDIVAAYQLVDAVLNVDSVERLRKLINGANGINTKIVPVHALETDGVNEIPAALAMRLATRLGSTFCNTLVQMNTVGHTGADGFHRLSHQAEFAGHITAGHYILVDDFVGQGGTLANLIGYVHSCGATAIAATVLTGKPYSATIALDEIALTRLRKKHGHDVENWWQEKFGFDFSCLTRSEARYLENTEDVDTIRNRITTGRP